MTRTTLLSLLLTATALVASSCVSSTSTCQGQYEVCDVYCDAFTCWEECYTEYYCVDRTTDYVQCRSSRDCYSDEICVNGVCELTNVRGTAGLCETCSQHEDCAEPTALCLQLAGSTETVCGRACSLDTDCPTGFVCSNLTDREGSQCIPETNTCEQLPPECTSSDDCTNQESCVEGSCEPISTGCSSSAECGPEERCDASGACVMTQCSDTRPCGDGLSCTDGRCINDGTCATNADCPGTDVCLNAACVSTCQKSAECGEGLFCSNGVCTSDAHLECRFNADCAEGEICVDANCVRACDDANPCPSNFACTAGFCEPSEGGCASDADCPANAMCDTGGACVARCAVSCECPTGLSCDKDSGLCVDLPAPDACVVSCDCPSGQVCAQGQCQL